MKSFLRSHYGRRVLLAVIAAVALAASPVVPGDQKLKTAGIVFVVAFVALLMFKPGGGGRQEEQPAAGSRDDGERSEGAGGAPQGAPTGRSGSRAGVSATAGIYELDGLTPDNLMRLAYDPPEGDQTIRRNALLVIHARMEEMVGHPLPLPQVLQQSSRGQGGASSATFAIPEIKPKRR